VDEDDELGSGGKTLEPMQPMGQDMPLPIFANEIFASDTGQGGIVMLTFLFKVANVDDKQVVARVIVPDNLMRQWGGALARAELQRQIREQGGHLPPQG
jgi:hypothetical protein